MVEMNGRERKCRMEMREGRQNILFAWAQSSWEFFAEARRTWHGLDECGDDFDRDVELWLERSSSSATHKSPYTKHCAT
jgi:hypothetical protein